MVNVAHKLITYTSDLINSPFSSLCKGLPRGVEILRKKPSDKNQASQVWEGIGPFNGNDVLTIVTELLF